MPVTIKTNVMKYKSSQGEYKEINAVSDHTAAEQIALIQSTGAAQVQAVRSAGTTQVGNVNSAGSTQITNINNRATEIENSWPSDYSDLTDDVDSLKSAINYKINSFTEATDNLNAVENGRYRIDNAGVIKSAGTNYFGMKYVIPILPSTSYAWNILDHGATTNIIHTVMWYDVNGDKINKEELNRVYTDPSVLIESPSTAYFMCISAYSSNGLSDNSKIVILQSATVRPRTYISPFSALDITARNEAGQNTNQIENLNVLGNLFQSEIAGTTQTVTFDSDENPATITHSKDGVTIRTDVFTWGTDTVTEVRTLSSGEYITIVTDLDTLETTISEVQEVA